MFHLVYTSLAENPFSDEALLGLLDQARKTNHHLGITGLLLYQRDAFMQALEGEETIVRTLCGAIRNDSRHHHVVTLVARSVPARQFPYWSMGFRHLEDASFRPVLGYDPDPSLPSPGAELDGQAAIALRLLGNFTNAT